MPYKVTIRRTVEITYEAEVEVVAENETMARRRAVRAANAGQIEAREIGTREGVWRTYGTVVTPRQPIGGGALRETHVTAMGLTVLAGRDADGKAYSVRETRYGNWYGYKGSRRVELFMGSWQEQRDAAVAWLRERVVEAR